MYFFSPKNCRTGSRKTFKNSGMVVQRNLPDLSKGKVEYSCPCTF